MSKDIVLVTDYHDKRMEYRWFNEVTAEERRFSRPTEVAAISAALNEALAAAVRQGGEVVWIMESTTGWARVKTLIEQDAHFLTVNVLQLSLPPKARRRKTDQLDTARLLREYKNGELPSAYQPPRSLRRLRRLVDSYESLVRRRTALCNYVNRYLAHETWHDRPDLNTKKGRRYVEQLARKLPGWDRPVIETHLRELADLAVRTAQVKGRLERVAARWTPARRLDLIKGVGPVSAVGMLARIGDIRRFADPDALIAYAGLAPGVRRGQRSAALWRLRRKASTACPLRHIPHIAMKNT